MEEIFDIWPNAVVMAKALSRHLGRPVGEFTVRSWRRREMIPAKYDRAIVSAAAECGRALSLVDVANVRAEAFAKRENEDAA